MSFAYVADEAETMGAECQEEDFLLLAEQVLERSRAERAALLEESLAQLVYRFCVEWRERYPEDGERAARFLSAVTLMLEWKAALLLPQRRTSKENEREEEPLPQEGELFSLEQFRQIAALLAARREEQSLMLRREPLPPGALQAEAEDPLQRVSVEDLQEAFRRIVRKLTTEIEQEQVSVRSEKVSRRECLTWLLRLLQENSALHLEQIFRLCPPQRAYWVVVFLLLLELISQQKVNVAFGGSDIWLSLVV